ncbi:Flp pilus assembly protein, pilin Flp [Methylobacterium sp. 174MFSha1.1]|uniref:Flp family type IVb pilin n=1 Tax=Methylobacterium sp. 174MFSha1.1 TaxID=1502749 RepID=UPI0008EABC1B|nr:Flp family type IVb pilin [Methylobacterium sp. 174MFSha1.1]SFV16307.1 Flp pilus assembly protein, pilin Flp [Methylobacterium sp. 174MFSha1.1]
MRGRSRVTEALRRFRREQSGATAIEYALIAALIVLALMGALSVYGNTAGGLYSNLSNSVVTALR